MLPLHCQLVWIQRALTLIGFGAKDLAHPPTAWFCVRRYPPHFFPLRDQILPDSVE